MGELLSFTSAWSGVIKYPVLIIMAICALFIIVVVMSQPSNESGIGALNGQQQETFLGKNKSKTFEHKMKILTVISGIVFAVLCVLFAIVTFLCK